MQGLLTHPVRVSTVRMACLYTGYRFMDGLLGAQLYTPDIVLGVHNTSFVISLNTRRDQVRIFTSLGEVRLEYILVSERSG